MLPKMLKCYQYDVNMLPEHKVTLKIYSCLSHRKLGTKYLEALFFNFILSYYLSNTRAKTF